MNLWKYIPLNEEVTNGNHIQPNLREGSKSTANPSDMDTLEKNTEIRGVKQVPEEVSESKGVCQLECDFRIR